MNHHEPRRLRDADDAVGKLLRNFSATPSEAAEARVWKRLTQHRAPKLRRWSALALGAGAAAMLLVVVWPQLSPSHNLEVVVAELHGEVAVSKQRSVSPGAHVALGQTLSTGAGDATLRLEGVGRAVMTQHTEVGVAPGQALTLARGRLYLQVERQSAENPLTITTQSARVVVLGTLFWVHVEPTQTLEVQVFEGVVEVRDAYGNHRVGPGERYPSAVAPPTEAERAFMVRLQQGLAGSPPTPSAWPARPPVPTETPLRPSAPHDKASKPRAEHSRRPSGDSDEARYDEALLLAKRDPVAAIRELDKLAAQPGERRALARYQAARICENVSLKEATERFTTIVNAGNSPFDVEARLSLIEVLLKQQAWQPARRQVAQFVARYPVSERMAELRFLRAEIRRQHENDCAGALEDYDAAQSLPTRAEDARYFRAWCLMKVGQSEAATTALEQYLERYPQGRHAAQARERLASEPMSNH